MPLFDYRCEDCRQGFEVLVTSTKDQKEVKCPQCGSARVVKVISAGSYRLSSGGSGSLSGCSSRSGFS